MKVLTSSLISCRTLGFSSMCLNNVPTTIQRSSFSNSKSFLTGTVSPNTGRSNLTYNDNWLYLFIWGFMSLSTGHIMTDRFGGRGNQYIQLIKVLYCELSTLDKWLPTFPHKVRGLNHRPQRWEASVLQLHHHDP